MGLRNAIVANSSSQKNAPTSLSKRSVVQDIKSSMHPEDQGMSILQMWNHFIVPRLLISIGRLLTIFLAYMYHDWQSFIELFWITHGTFILSKSFANITRRVYLPMFTVITLFYYLVNIDRIIPKSFYKNP